MESDIDENTIIHTANYIYSSKSDLDDNTLLSLLQLTIRKHKPNHPQPPIWGKTKRFPSPPPFGEVSGIPVKIVKLNPTPCFLFQLVFNEIVRNHIVFQTNLYVEQEQLRTGKPYKKTAVEEINAFLGIKLLMEIKLLPSYQDYCSSAPDLYDPCISSRMPHRNDFTGFWEICTSTITLLCLVVILEILMACKVQPLLNKFKKALKYCLLPSKVLALASP